MIPRYQRILFFILLGSSLLMAGILIWLHQRAHVSPKATDSTPIDAPSFTGVESVPFTIANDEDGTITNAARDVALPAQPAIRARALLEKLLAAYALPESTHPLPGGIAVDDVFLVDLPLRPPTTPAAGKKPALTPALTKDDELDPLTHASGELAIINLRSSWLEDHPSGIQAETFTILSIIGTLHENLPSITHVRFLVDGASRPTLAGHVDLTRTFACVDTTNTTRE